MRSTDDHIYIANKPAEAYAVAVLTSFSHGIKRVRIQGLGQQAGKVLAVAKLLSDTGQARIVEIKPITKEGIKGTLATL
ncbi:MAG: hypothetical protein QXT02_06380, partial [Candidatus Hadarchaeum sp.]